MTLKFSMIFTADTSAVSKAAVQVGKDLDAVTADVKDASAAFDKQADILREEAAAAREAAKAARELSDAEKAARAAANRPQGTSPRASVPSIPRPTSGGPWGSESGGPTGRELDDLRARYVPLYEAQRTYRREIAEIQRLQKLEALSADESAAALTRAKTAYDRQIEVIKRASPELREHGQRMKLTADEARNLSYQINDTVQSLALGMPVSQVILQQGPQAVQIYGGVGNTLKAIGQAATPARLAIGGITAAVATGALAWNDYLFSIKAVGTAASGLGRSTAGTASEMEAAARAGAAAAGIGIKQARAMEVQFLRTGRIASANFEAMISLSKNYAATLGITSDEAGAALAEMFADPAKAAATLYRQYGLIDGATAQYATRLANQNRLAEAQKVILDALPGRLAQATEATTALGRAWQYVSTSASGAYDWIGRAIDRELSGPSLDERIAEARADYERFSRTSSSFILGTLNGGADRAAAAKADLDRLSAERRRLEEDRARVRDLEQRRQSGAAAIGLSEASPATSALRQRQALEDQIEALRRGANAPGLSDEQRNGITRALDAKTRALQTLIPSEERAAALGELDIRIQNERNPLILANLIADRERLQLAGEEIETGKAQAQISAARNRAINEEIAASRARSIQTNEEIEIRRAVNDAVSAGTMSAAEAEALLRREIELRPLAAAAAAAQGEEQRRLTDALNGAREAQQSLLAEERRAGALAMITSQNEKLETLKLERELIGATERDRERLTAALEAEQEIRRRGLDSMSAEAAQIRSNASAIAEQTSELQRAADAWDQVRSAGESAIDGLFDKLSDGDWKGAVEDAAKELVTGFRKLAVDNPLKNLVLGTNYGTLDDVASHLFGGGDPLSAITGGLGKPVGSMSVMAGTVMINGGAAGGFGSSFFGLGANGNRAAGGDISLFRQAIGNIESRGSGGYAALGPLVNGDRAYGNYQVMGSNIPSWTQSALGKSLTPQQFLADPRAQDSVFDHYFGKSLSKYGNPQDAASVWFTGRPLARGANASDVFGTTGSAYVDKFNTELDRLSGAAGKVTGSIGGLGDATGQAAKGLGALGGGFDKFGQNLSKLSFPAAPGLGGGSLGGIFSLFPGIGGFLGSSQLTGAISRGSWGLWDTGGYTGNLDPKDVAGFVHGQEFVVKASVVAKPGVRSFLQALNDNQIPGFDVGGYVPSRRGSVSPSPAFSSPMRQAAAGQSALAQLIRLELAIGVHLIGGEDFRAELMSSAQSAGAEASVQVVERYDGQLPDRVSNIMENPRWR
ncbi:MULTISPECIES: phage tail length tape measure family protein [unclassified Ensifer]|uniref:phage tail length tape measure family protein n=1 Tax=unclassified Ensifer TaxID=2633371 RepID=UPI000812EEBB|nr:MULTISPECIES: phage tail length tape measure family protein [unclassified Ensifer]OCP17372.1 hypothetical protein BC361_07890 [Ensifer sp. LC54]OCP28723.1 hypothetical protein BC363_02470 [Ensifer sp. LC384]